METTPRSELLLPRASLSQCIFGAFLRDTRGAGLPEEQRFNHFAASPLCGVSLFFEGNARRIATASDVTAPQSAVLYPAPAFIGPQSVPQTSWNDGDILGMIVVLYPEAIAAIAGLNQSAYLDKVVPLHDPSLGSLAALFAPALSCDDPIAAFEAMQDALEPAWESARPRSGPAFGRRVSDWSRSLALRAMLSPSGHSLRQMQRRIKASTGHSLRYLTGYEKSDTAFEIALQDRRAGVLDIAGIAAEAGFADQSHMGRVVRAQTGFSPGDLMKRMENDEAFWSFRLLGEVY